MIKYLETIMEPEEIWLNIVGFIILIALTITAIIVLPKAKAQMELREPTPPPIPTEKVSGW